MAGKSLTVRFGALGSSGQVRTKAFASPAVAQAELEKLVREKTSKGYVEGRPVVRRVPKGGDAELVRAALVALEHFLKALPPPLTTELVKAIPPLTKQQLAAFEKRTKRALSPGARTLFAQGFTIARVIGDDGNGFGHVDLLPLATIAKRLSWWGDWKAEEENDAVGWQLRRAQKRFGVPLWENENTIVVDGETGAVSRCSGEPTPSDPIAKSLGEFLVHFVGAGCFSCGGAERAHFKKYWKHVEAIVPFGIAPKQNLWLRHLDRWYRGNLTK